MKNLKKFYNDKNILITGGAGFIGSHLAIELIKLNAHVTILDNFSTGKLSNLKEIISNINITCGDITNPFTCKKATRNKDIVFHLAALTSVAYSVENPEICYKINIEGTKNLLEGCKQNNVSKFIFSSSASIYGNRDNICKESDKPHPESPYAKSKVEGERLCKEYNQKHNLNTGILRYFNVYGENQDPNGDYAAVVAKFSTNIKNNVPIKIYGTGKQKRDFIHVKKVALANIKLASLEKINNQIINVATGKSIDLLELLKKLEFELEKKAVKINFYPERAGDILNSVASNKKYKSLNLI